MTIVITNYFLKQRIYSRRAVL